MPDITYRLIGDDQLTPQIQKALQAFQSLAAAAKLAAAQTTLALQPPPQTTGVPAPTAPPPPVAPPVAPPPPVIPPIVPPHPAGGGGGGAHAQHGPEWVKELLAGITYNIGLWNVGMMASQAVVDTVTKAVQDAIETFQGLGQIMASTGETAAQAAPKWTSVATAALLTGKTFKETMGSIREFQTTGMSFEQATTRTQMVQRVMQDTGVDIANATKRVQGLTASFADLITLSQGGPEFKSLEAPAIAGAREEAFKPMVEMEMQYRQKAAAEEMQDRHLLWQRDMEDSHIAADRSLEDFTKATNREMQDRHHAIEREMELRHLAANRQMEDSVRAIDRSTSLEDQQYNRRVGLLGGIAGAAEQALGIFHKGMKAEEFVPPEVIRALQPIMAAGQQQLMKDIPGLTPESIQGMIRNKQLSPNVLIQEAQAARQEMREEARWAREDQQRELQRKFQNEELRVQEKLYREQVQTVRALSDLAQQLSRRTSDEERTANRTMFDEELEMNRKAAQERLDLEYNFVRDKLELELKALDIIEAKEIEVAEKVTKEAEAMAERVAAGDRPGRSGQFDTDRLDQPGEPKKTEKPPRSETAVNAEKAFQELQRTHEEQKAGLDRIHKSNVEKFKTELPYSTTPTQPGLPKAPPPPIPGARMFGPVIDLDQRESSTKGATEGTLAQMVNLLKQVLSTT